MKIFDHTIYAPNRTPKFEKTSVSSVPSVVNKQTTSGSDISLTNSAFMQFRTSNYTWGLDLSQTIQGAGGVSGLLSLDKGTATYYYTYIADKCNDEGVKTSNENGLEEALYEGFAFELIDTAGVVVAHYEYSPFGKLTKEILNSQFVINNSFKFSTKYLDNETQLYYYGLRYYNPETGRWINRDPIRERGGNNLYGFLNHNPINYFDLLGLVTKTFLAKQHAYSDIMKIHVDSRCKNLAVLYKASIGDGIDRQKAEDCIGKAIEKFKKGLTDLKSKHKKEMDAAYKQFTSDLSGLVKAQQSILDQIKKTSYLQNKVDKQNKQNANVGLAIGFVVGVGFVIGEGVVTGGQVGVGAGLSVASGVVGYLGADLASDQSAIKELKEAIGSSKTAEDVLKALKLGADAMQTNYDTNASSLISAHNTEFGSLKAQLSVDAKKCMSKCLLPGYTLEKLEHE